MANGYNETVLKEYAKIGKYRTRKIENGRGTVLDVREYISADKFEGFTRRGIRVNRADAVALRDNLNAALEDWPE
jgi:hypothetical protein